MAEEKGKEIALRPAPAKATAYRHLDFAKRFRDASDDSGLVPQLNKGRLMWFKHHLEKDFNIEVTKETVRKWMAGEVIPRNEKMRALAELLKVDEGWLAFGISADTGISARASALQSGAATVLAGFMQLNGANIAIPEAGSPDDFAGFYVILNGKMRKICAAPSEMLNRDEYRLYIPNRYSDCIVTTVLHTGPLEIEILKLPHDMIAQFGRTRGPAMEMEIVRSGAQWAVEGNILPRVRDVTTDLA
ncbi:helix-turn-helix domain-containing protein [Azospirillum doebereinerae]|uniref:Helix-turn-helix domain-containing protein n=1 Tax=Azospirillum doebereinerae TaxID=92933 RepID=A0A433J0G2_9PROT|nr:helix-turn-helix domain-containing protein [Azospirillum doebereinerae]MCG5243534.1 helix-turn-helix domain-containing protein [Azospirillum doebereinerae]RUQ62529.1 helix-turn-helix domain-containing protein [Azospirillum doebereinerae]